MRPLRVVDAEPTRGDGDEEDSVAEIDGVPGALRLREKTLLSRGSRGTSSPPKM